jgi:predicted metal-dependent peptidase
VSAEPDSEVVPDPQAAPGSEAFELPPAHLALDRVKVLAARFRAANERPYLASAMYALSIVPSWHVPTMGVDRHWRCYVNPKFVQDTEVHLLAGVWQHEVAHVLRDHHGRAQLLPAEQQGDWHRVNIAEDCEINDDLAAEQIQLPGGVFPKTWGMPDGLLFEQYLKLLPPEVTQPVQCGSGAHGVGQSWELSEQAGPGLSEVEAQSLRRITAEGIRRNRGNIAAGWHRWAQRVLEPTIDWRRHLSGAIREALAWSAGAIDYSNRRPSRRSSAMPKVVLPSLVRPLPKVAVVVDTSGSMSGQDLAVALAEINGVLMAVGVGGNQVTVLSCDADIHNVRQVRNIDQVELLGGGGTDMRVGIEGAINRPDPPNVVIVLTDGYTPWPDQPPRARLIAGLIGTDAQAAPEWIESIRIPTSG